MKWRLLPEALLDLKNVVAQSYTGHVTILPDLQLQDYKKVSLSFSLTVLSHDVGVSKILTLNLFRLYINCVETINLLFNIWYSWSPRLIIAPFVLSVLFFWELSSIQSSSESSSWSHGACDKSWTVGCLETILTNCSTLQDWDCARSDSSQTWRQWALEH